ncbi:MAG: hypothetical protein KAH06_04130, partial [Desulfobacterales bacterium]|nr:hypothetical protein [Desulfobacterales bacterium]
SSFIPVVKGITDYTADSLVEGTTYFFVVTAVDTTGNESGNSSEISKTIILTTPAPAPLPSPWQNNDIGSPAQTGTASFENDTFTIESSGADIWDTSDQFHFVNQTLNGDGEIISRVVSQENTNMWAKSGVMIREALTANSKYAMMMLTPGNGSAFQYRAGTGSSSLDTTHPNDSFTAPYWVKLVRRGNTFTGFNSESGTTWVEVGTVTIEMATEIYTGLAVTSHDTSSFCTSGFDNVQINKDLPDTTAPTVAITSPSTANTHETKESSINLAGSAADNVGVKQVTWYNSRGGESGTATGTQNWSASNISLADGDNEIAITAMDDAGNTGTRIITVTYNPDTIAPLVLVSSPTSAGFYATAATSIILGGTVQDDSSIAEVTWTNSRGGNGSASGTTSWTISNVPLMEGENIITITATDNYNNTGERILTVNYTPRDETAPTVEIESPVCGSVCETNHPVISVSGTAFDAVGVTEVRWRNFSKVNSSGTASGTTSWTAPGIPLVEGSNDISIIATDGAGNIGSLSLAVAYILPPDITNPALEITNPTGIGIYATSSALVDISGTASDDREIDDVTWVNMATGKSGTAAGTAVWSVSGITLNEGDNSIIITAKDAAGNENSKTLHVTHAPPVTADTTVPEVTITMPSVRKFYFTRDPIINISGTASDNSKVTAVTWSNSTGESETAAGTTANWSANDIQLAKWWNKITVTATDTSGNESTRRLTVFCWKR